MHETEIKFFFSRHSLVGDDWEDYNKRMAEEHEGSFFDTAIDEHATRDSGFVTMDRGYSTTTQEVSLCMHVWCSVALLSFEIIKFA